MKQILFGYSSAVLLTLPGITGCTKNDVNNEKPNVVFIIADDLGYGDLSCYGQQKFQTPNIDRLATEGMRFSQCYSGATVSAPSRANLITGLHSGHAPIRGNREMKPEGQFSIPQSTNTIFKAFKDKGYTTGAFGKWGLGAPGSEGDPNKQYVDDFFGYNCQLLAHNYYPDHLWHNDKRIDLPENENGAFGVYSQDLIQEKCLDFIDNNKDEPFFLFVPCVLPHAELLVPEDSIIQKFRGQFPERPYVGTDSGPNFRKGNYCSQTHPRATFAAMVSRFDLYVGQIVRKLKELDLYDNTLIIVTSDNGPHMEGGADPDFFNSSGPYRGRKRDLYEGGIRVPMIAVWKDRIEGGANSDFMCAFWDILPTFSDILNLPEPSSDGVSLLPTFTKKGKQQEHNHLYFEFHEQGGRQAVRKENWKLIRLNIAKEGGVYELYNIADDPSESQNLAEAHPEKVAELKIIMEQCHLPNESWPLRGVD
ncbi:arylsulfatase [Bacteroidales bacterium OttesenSCG-928-A17]|nr:arylsulfatase [Bacteroidales bacterium OttesenSCG-928-A17]